MDATVRANSDTGGLGADSDANDDGSHGIHVDGTVRTAITGTATLFGALVYLSATAGAEHDLDAAGAVIDALDPVMDRYKAFARSDADATALGADSDAAAVIVISDLVEVTLDGAADGTRGITASDRVDLRATHENLDLRAVARADCSCGGGDTDATATIDYESSSKVAGRNDAIIRTAVLWVEAFQDPDGIERDADSDGGLFDGGSEDENGDSDRGRTDLLGGDGHPARRAEPGPRDRRPGHDRREDAQRRRHDVQPGLAHVRGLLAVGDSRSPPGSWIVVGDLIYDETGFIHFEANDVPSSPGIDTSA